MRDSPPDSLSLSVLPANGEKPEAKINTNYPRPILPRFISIRQNLTRKFISRIDCSNERGSVSGQPFLVQICMVQLHASF